MCHLLIVWLLLMSGGSHAHGTSDAAHGTGYDHDHSTHWTQNHAPAIDAVTTADAAPADACNQSHCGHGHMTGVLTQHATSVKTDGVSCAPKSRASWVSSLITSNIERPKWAVTTPAVVNFLS